MLSSATMPAAGEHAALAQVAADHAAIGARPRDERARSREDGADRRAQPLGDAEGDAVAMGGDRGGIDAEPDRGIEEPRAVDVNGDALGVAERVNRRHVGERQHRAAGIVMRRLQGDERGGEAVGQHCRVDRLAHCLDIHGAARAGKGAMEEPGESGNAAELGAQDVRARLAHHLAAAPAMGEEGDEVAHRAADQEEPGLLAGAPGGELFQAADGRIALAAVVAAGRAAHGVEHGCGRPGDGVAAQIDGRGGGHGGAFGKGGAVRVRSGAQCRHFRRCSTAAAMVRRGATLKFALWRSYVPRRGAGMMPPQRSLVARPSRKGFATRE
jgi:hypothetical protein